MTFLAATNDNLGRIIPGYAQLRPIEKKRINEFSLVWQMFEGRVFDNRANGERLLAENWFRQSAEEIYANTSASINHFRERYCLAPDAIERRASLLGPREGNMRQRMQDCIERGLERQLNERDVVRACAVVGYRLRNNLFHGEKANYGFEGQLENLTHGVRFLNACLHELR